jgi:two-component system, cell cycle response regulator CtrA
MSSKILVVEDDPDVMAFIRTGLAFKEYETIETASGKEAIALAKTKSPDLVLLDLMLPDIDGYEVLKRLRAHKVATPILILSGLSEMDAKLKGLGFGADDYLTKPFDRRELIARIQAIVRRSKGHAASVLKTGRLTIDLGAHAVEVDGKPVHLTGKEYGILELLSLRKGSTLTKEMFLNHLYGGMDEPELKIIDVFICKLRKKIAKVAGGDNFLATVWGRGYVLKDPGEAKAKAS